MNNKKLPLMRSVFCLIVACQQNYYAQRSSSGFVKQLEEFVDLTNRSRGIFRCGLQIERMERARDIATIAVPHLVIFEDFLLSKLNESSNFSALNEELIYAYLAALRTSNENSKIWPALSSDPSVSPEFRDVMILLMKDYSSVVSSDWTSESGVTVQCKSGFELVHDIDHRILKSMKDILSGQGTMSVKIEPKSSISFEHGEVEHGEFEGTSQKKLERLTVGYVIEHSSAFAKPWQSYLLRDNRVADMPSLPLESFTMKLYTGNGKECGSVRMTFKREKIGNKTSSEVSDSKWIEQPDLTGVVASCLVTEPR